MKMNDYDEKKKELEDEIKFLKKELIHIKGRISYREEELRRLEEMKDVPVVDDLDIDVRTRNMLKRSGICTVNELMVYFNVPRQQGLYSLLEIKQFGVEALLDVVKALKSRGDLPAEYEVAI